MGHLVTDGNVWAINNAANSVGYNFNHTYRVVAKVDFEQGVTSMWVDPDSPDDPPVATKNEVMSVNPILIIRC